MSRLFKSKKHNKVNNCLNVKMSEKISSSKKIKSINNTRNNKKSKTISKIKKRANAKQKSQNAWFSWTRFVLPFLMICAVLFWFIMVWMSRAGKVYLGIILFVTLICLFAYLVNLTRRKIHRHHILKHKAFRMRISDNRHDYIIESSDYRRGNKKEHAYRRYFQLSLLKIYNNSCAKCNRNDNGIDMDHFFLSKNEGGSFALKHKEGYIINNAVPLCITCNRKKSDKSYLNFFTKDELNVIFEKNLQATKALNQFGFFEKIGQAPAAVAASYKSSSKHNDVVS